MKQRIKTGLFIFLATALAILSKLLPLDIGTYIFDIFIVIIAVIASFEISNIMDKMERPTNKMIVCMYPLVYYILLLISLNNNLDFSMITVVQLIGIVVYFLFATLVEAVKSKSKDFRKNVNVGLNTIIACMYPGFWFCLFLNINHVDIFGGQYFSLIFIILIVAITMITDTMAYFVGSRLKGPKLAPSISPNKTISGAVGGLIGGIIGAMLVYLVVRLIPGLNAVLTLHNIAWWHFLILGLFGSVVGQIGDLFESKLKRNASVKDSGDIFPGHGGMLDRIDAMIFVAIFVFLYIVLIIG